MARKGSLRARLQRGARGLAERLAVAPLVVLSKVLPALPERAVRGLARVAADLLSVLDRRGRRAALEGLAAVYGDEMPPAERRRVMRGAYRTAVLAEALLFHVQPMTPARFARYVRVAPEDEARLRALAARHRGWVVASAHFGNWEMLLAAADGLGYLPPTDYVAESTGSLAVDRLFERLRAHAGGRAAMRKGGAVALRASLTAGRCVSLLADRNVPSRYGGTYVPFLGIPARTTPVPAKLAWWHEVPLAVALLVPEGEARWRLWVSGDLMERTGDEERDVAAALARVNDVFSRAIREHPEAWAWMLKRWKSRPTPELGPYPPYSLLDADEPS